MKKVSIIIAAYNIEKYIERCILSVVNQTLRDIEIIVVNDGSNDRTLEIIKKISLNDNRVIIINKKNEGLIEARKSGLNIATGEYLLFIDGDDWLEIDATMKLYKKAIYDNSDIIIYNTYWSYDYKKDKKKAFKNENLILEQPLKELFLGEMIPSIWSKFIKRDYLEKNKIEFPRNICYGEDLATVSSLLMKKPKISILNEYLYNYYQSENSITRTKNERILELNTAIDFIKDLLISNNLYNEYKLYFEYMIYEHLFANNFLSYHQFDETHKKLYKQYKLRSIDISNNPYIIDKIDRYPPGLKIRNNMYIKGYGIGRLYDKFRKLLINDYVS